MIFFSVMNSSEQKVKGTSKITWRSCKGNVKATLRLWHDWVGDNTRFDHWAIIQESCLITRKLLLIDVLSFLDLHYIDLSWLAIIYRWAIIQESCLITRKPLLTDVLSFLDMYYIDLSLFGNYFRWAIIQESCLITRKPLLIYVLSFLDLSTYI